MVILDNAATTPSPSEVAMAELVFNHPDQGREVFVHNEVLNFLARRKAQDMADRAYFSHTDPGGFAQNFIARAADYYHPYMTSRCANSIESISARHQNGISEAQAAGIVFQGWLDSPLHRLHVMAGNSGHQVQT